MKATRWCLLVLAVAPACDHDSDRRTPPDPSASPSAASVQVDSAGDANLASPPRASVEGPSSASPANSVDAAPTSASTSVSAAESSGGRAAGAGAANFPVARTEGCPAGMVWVEGDYCPVVIQNCLEHHPEFKENPESKTVSDRCLRFSSPTRCFSKKLRALSFCMDRFEYPNRVGTKPIVLTSWLRARELCAAEGKRLCTEDEFNFACEGPEMRPYVYGFERNAALCNIDRPYAMPDHTRGMLQYENCLKDPRCSEEFARLDQRLAIGERLSCVSWAGVVDLNGNVNEWVNVPGGKPPRRSGLKGGWWGPVRNRCRPTVMFHKEDDFGYEAGFRCCSDRTPPAGATPVTP